MQGSGGAGVLANNNALSAAAEGACSGSPANLVGVLRGEGRIRSCDVIPPPPYI